MYVPPANAVGEDELREMVRAVATAELISTGADGYPRATLLPVLWRAGDGTGSDTVVAHFARANPHWREIGEDTPVLLVCGGPQAYVSPSWYASKAEHGKVVPTWNYSAVHITGRARLHDEPAWLHRAVADLTDAHEADRDRPWQVGDAPAAFTAGQLRGIVGVEVRVERIEGKAKLSQNRSEADRRGVVDGLRGEPGAGPRHVAAAMARELDETP